MSKCYYLKLPNGEKIPVFSNNECYPLEKPKFCDQFIELWELLYNVGIANRSIFSGVIDSFPVPTSLSSTLVGVPFIVDPTSIVRIFSFTNSNLDGPIVTEGYNLQTYNDVVSYEIKWSIRDDFDDFTIGFYRSDGFVEDETNTFSLICGSDGASIFNKTSGKIISPGISNLFVATNRDTIIDLKVRVIIPDKVIYPEVNLYQDYKKFITIRDCCGNKHKILVYTISRIDGIGFPINKYPSKYFIEATRVIQDFLLATGLSVTLTDSSLVPLVPALGPNNCVGLTGCGVDDIGKFIYKSSNASESVVSMDTHLTFNPQYWGPTLADFSGIKLDPGSGQVSRITFEITTTDKGAFLGSSYRANVRIQYLSFIFWYTHGNIDNLGEPNGDAEITYDLASSTNVITLSHNFRLPETAKAFAISVYYSANSNLPDRDPTQALADNTIFKKVAIQYEDRYPINSR